MEQTARPTIEVGHPYVRDELIYKIAQKLVKLHETERLDVITITMFVFFRVRSHVIDGQLLVATMDEYCRAAYWAKHMIPVEELPPLPSPNEVSSCSEGFGENGIITIADLRR